jgi:excisionase family DNA binding protein
MMNDQETHDFYSIKEFAKKLRVHPNTIRKAIKIGYINALRIGKSEKSGYRIPNTEIHNLAQIQWESVVTKVAKEQDKRNENGKE